MSASTTQTISEYTVTGMTCGHCVSSVTTEISAIDGVQAVQVDLATGAVSVTSAAPLDDAAVTAAVEEAGYELAPAPAAPDAGCCGSCH